MASSAVPTEENQDELILRQENEISKEIAVHIPLIGEVEDLKVLEKEYKDDEAYKKKVDRLLEKYKYLRRARPDGNCFFRAVGFRYLEDLLGNKEEIKKFRDVVTNGRSELIAKGYPDVTIDDFYETVITLIGSIEKGMTLEDLCIALNDSGTAEYFVFYLRLLTSLALQKDSEFYGAFIEGGRTVAEFCKQEVEVMYQDSDHIHAMGLTSALNTPIAIVYMDRGGAADNLVIHNIPDGTTPNIHLLYRPGHYDILYV